MNKFLVFILFVSLNLFAQSNLNNKFRLGNSYEQSGKLEKAMKIYEDVVQQQPNNNQYSTALNNIYLKLKKYDLSISFLKKKIAKRPNDASLYGMLGATYFIKGDNSLAVKTWNKGLSVNNNSLINYTIISNYAIQNRAFEYSIKILTEAKSKTKNPAQFSYQLAQIYSYTMDYKNAAKEYCSVLSAQPSQLDYVKRRIEIYLSAVNALDETIKVVEECEKNNATKELLAFLYIRNKNFENAFELTKELEKSNGGNGAIIFNFASELYQRKEYNIASKAYKYLLENYPKSRFFPQSKIGYAKTLEAKLDIDWNNRQDNWKPVFITDTSNAYKYYPIIDTYKSIIKSSKGEIENEAFFRIGLIYENRLMDYNKASKNFEKIITNSSLSRFSPKANFELGKIYVEMNKLNQGKEKFLSVIKNNRSDKTISGQSRFLLAKIELALGNIDKSLKLLSELNRDLSNDFANDAIGLSLAINLAKRKPTDLQTYAQADLAVYRGDFTTAEKKFKQLSDNNTLVLVNNIAKVKYTEILVAKNKYPEAIENLKQLSTTKEMNIFVDKSLYLLAQVYEFGIGDKKSAIKNYEKFLEKFPNSLYIEKVQQNLKRLNNKK